MWLKILAIASSALVITVIYQVVSVIKKNWIAHQFFKLKSPNLPALPNPNIFSGHAQILYWPHENWKNADDFFKKYGPTYAWFYCDQPTVNTIDLELIKTIVIDEPNDHINRVELIVPMREFKDDNIAMVHDEQWWRLRKSMAPAFTNHKVQSPNVQDDIDAVIEQFIGSLELRFEKAKSERKETSILVDADDVFHRYSLALAFRCFYKQENIVDFHGEEDPHVRIIEDTLKDIVNPFMLLCTIFPILTPIVEKVTKKFHVQGRMTQTVTDFIKQQTKLNLKAKQQIKKALGLNKDFNKEDFIMDDGTRFRRNMVDYIIDQFHLGKLTDTEYLHSTFFLILAATKTTADALSKLVYHLAAHQEVQDKLRDSISAGGTETEYLHWCISESLRLFPPVNAGCSRIITRDMESKAGLIPAGTLVATPAFSVNRNKEIWGPDADEYKPDRWIHSKNFNPVQYISFGAGKRNCLGKDFALNATKKLIVEMLPRYKFLPSPDTNAETIAKFGAPGFIYLVSDYPTHIRICRI